RERRLRRVDAITLRQAHVAELLCVEETLQLAQAARELCLDRGFRGGGERGVAHICGERLQRRDAGREREQFLVVAGRLQLAVELGVGVEEGLAGDGVSDQRRIVGRQPWVPRWLNRRVGISAALRGSRGRCRRRDASFGAGPLYEQICRHCR